MRTVFVTGISGYVGRCFVRNSRDKFRIVGLDVRRERGLTGVEFYEGDVRSAKAGEVLRKVRPDTLLHLAFVFNPPEDRDEARSINVDGTRNILRGALEAGVKHVVIVSSATCYGAHPDNPVPLKEDSPLRGDLNRGFWYSEDKVLQERAALEFARENPGVKVAVARPCIVLGANVKNFVSQSVFRPPVLFVARDDVPFQFIHEDDVAAAISMMIEREVSAVFNLAGAGYIYLSDMAQIMGKRMVKFPDSEALKKASLWLLKKFGVFDKNLPPAFIHFFSYPWVVDTRKARDELQFVPRYSSEEAFKRAYEAWHKR